MIYAKLTVAETDNLTCCECRAAIGAPGTYYEDEKGNPHCAGCAEAVLDDINNPNNANRLFAKAAAQVGTAQNALSEALQKLRHAQHVPRDEQTNSDITRLLAQVCRAIVALKTEGE